MLKITCDNCGLIFERKLCKIRIAEKHYCSKACKSEGQRAVKRFPIIKDDVVYLDVTKGNIAIFDLIDKDLAEFNWQSQKGYISMKNKEGKYIYMHRVILERKLGIVLTNNDEPDHINGDRSDNRRDNLRLLTHLENCANIKKPNRNNCNKKESRRYKGVSFDRAKQKWRARISHDGVTYHLGYFDTEKEAAREYDMAAIRILGVTAKLNLPSECYALAIHKKAGPACIEVCDCP
jgi:hypothetical protein